jgi:6-O-methylguanine DNA methyltransferase, DNA binding domain
MAELKDSIVEIAPQLERFFGCSGRMLKPCPETLAALIVQIPNGKISTTDSLRRTLANRFGVEVTCPYDTKMALLAIAQTESDPSESSPSQSDPSQPIPYWRVIKANGELMPKHPGGLEAHAALLQAEGFTVDTSGKKPKVKNFKDKLHQF